MLSSHPVTIFSSDICPLPASLKNERRLSRLIGLTVFMGYLRIGMVRGMEFGSQMASSPLSKTTSIILLI